MRRQAAAATRSRRRFPCSVSTLGSPLTAVGTKHDHFNQDTNSSDQLFAFALGGSLELAPETLCKKFKQMTAQVGRAMSPNLVVTLEGHHVLSPVVSSGNATLANSVQEANSVYCVTHPDSGFQFLLSKLHAMFRNGRNGRTVDATAFDRYFSTEGTLSLPGGGVLASLGEST